ncbi:hypothetical protein IAE22_29520, partial [Bacillus sp. S34]|nr:hypothetical protein [Bacillus sp. S34]
MVFTLGAEARPVAPAGQTSVRPTDLRAVQLHGGFLGDWQKINGTATIGHCVIRVESSGVLDNFRRLAGRSDAPFRGPEFADSDLYKTLEALGWEAARGNRLTEHDAFYEESLDLTRPESARDELIEFVPQLVREYGDVAATVAAEWYEQVRFDAVGAYNATTVNATDAA